MYIYETTAHDRPIIERALDGAFVSLDRAHTLLEEVLDAHFERSKQKPIVAHDAEAISVKLEIVGDIIFDALLLYALTVGNGDFRGVTPYLKSAERAALAVKVKRQLETTFPGIEGTERRMEIMGLPDEQAVKIMEEEGAQV